MTQVTSSTGCPQLCSTGATRCYGLAVDRQAPLDTLTQRELRNDSGEVMRKVVAGQHFVILRNGTPVAQIGPIPRSCWVPAAEAVRRFLAAPPVDDERWRSDSDGRVNQKWD